VTSSIAARGPEGEVLGDQGLGCRGDCLEVSVQSVIFGLWDSHASIRCKNLKGSECFFIEESIMRVQGS